MYLQNELEKELSSKWGAWKETLEQIKGAPLTPFEHEFCRASYVSGYVDSVKNMNAQFERCLND